MNTPSDHLHAVEVRLSLMKTDRLVVDKQQPTVSAAKETSRVCLSMPELLHLSERRLGHQTG